MTVERDTGPGSKASTKFTATVDGGANHVYGFSRAAGFGNRYWNAGDTVYTSWLNYGADAATTVVITRLAGAITSAVVYPTRLSIPATIVGSTVTIAMPANTKVFVIINNDWKSHLAIFSDEFSIAPLPGWVTYNGTQTEVANDTTLYFSPGSVYELNIAADHTGGPSAAGYRELDHQLFPVRARGNVHIARGAWVVGSFDMRGGADSAIYGYGVLSGEWASDSDIENILQGTGLTFGEQVMWSMFCGWDGGVDYQFPGMSVDGITIVGQPFYNSISCIHEKTNLKVFSHWWYNCDSLGVDNDTNTGERLVADCFALTGDDGLIFQDNWGVQVARDCFIIGNGGSPITLGYWPMVRDTFTASPSTTITNVDVMHLQPAADGGFNLFDGAAWGAYDPDVSPNGSRDAYSCSVIKLWLDGSASTPDYTRENITIDGLYVENSPGSPLFSIETNYYPWGMTTETNATPWIHDAKGDCRNIVIRNVTVDEMTDQPWRLVGQSHEDTPHDITFEGITVGGVAIDVRNWHRFIRQNEFPYAITVAGRTMVSAVDICNLALSHIGDTAEVTAIAPSDGSAQADRCAQFYAKARDAVLEMHPWSFATRRVALTAATFTDATLTSDNDSWGYAYVIPADMMRALAVLPPGASDDYSVPAVNSTSTGLSGGGTYTPQTYAIEMSSEDDLLIYTDIEDAVLRYTYYVTDPNLFSPQFVLALSWYLASLLAGPTIKGAEGSAQALRCLQMAQAALGKASASDANQRRIRPTQVVSWLNNR